MINNKKVIGIVGGHAIDKNDPFNDCYKTVSSYVKQLDLEKVVPISVLLDSKLLNFGVLDLCDAFILPGGKEMEMTTFYLIDYAIKNNKPVLGICLGAQTIAVYSCIKDKLKEGYSYDDVVKEGEKYKKENNDSFFDLIPKPNFHNHDKVDENCYHKIKIDKDSIAYDILKKEEMDVTSFHIHEIKKYGRDFRITAKAEDFVNEIIEYKKSPLVIGFQFHPELMNTEIFNYFIDRLYD